MKKIFVSLLILFSSFSYASDCNWGGNFIKASKYSELIVKVRVLDKYYHFEDNKTINQKDKAEFEDYLFEKNQNFYESITVEIIEVIKGREKRKIVEVFGSNGNDFKLSVSGFKKGKYYIFSLHKTVESSYNLPNEGKDDYHIDGCSENYLEYFPESNEVYGFIKGRSDRKKKRKYSYKKLKKKIKERNKV
ncbi:hypothetical protein F7018_15910 [Tenacibaculum aiptasiae]|uniref:Uncharacterized protein n=1 Tax=Tenacibaculum aiptasiae TaxID=426481 RepID=A0A7J5A958_9FLAO|nr:hypothetical protein [Tenacibaculum aiptasiae]KAB1153968.1 hypothetical protein F7018_15910 [Tenacibaculum aiptasiae]